MDADPRVDFGHAVRRSLAQQLIRHGRATKMGGYPCWDSLLNRASSAVSGAARPGGEAWGTVSTRERHHGSHAKAMPMCFPCCGAQRMRNESGGHRGLPAGAEHRLRKRRSGERELPSGFILADEVIRFRRGSSAQLQRASDAHERRGRGPGCCDGRRRAKGSRSSPSSQGPPGDRARERRRVDDRTRPPQPGFVTLLAADDPKTDEDVLADRANCRCALPPQAIELGFRDGRDGAGPAARPPPPPFPLSLSMAAAARPPPGRNTVTALLPAAHP